AGIYDCKFKHHVGDWKSSGTRANKKVSDRRTEIGQRNSNNVKFIYKSLHGGNSAPLSKMVGEAQKLFSEGKLYDENGGITPELALKLPEIASPQ
ncbi:hypothetical protein CYMTET_13231, partial [Cymbomonas tetramitiformis]